MNDLNIIDLFTSTFVTYIDSGFGLLGSDVAFLTTVLIGIDITLAGLFWAMADDKSIIPALIKKVLYVGAFAFILNNFSSLANIIFNSFAGLGLKAVGSPISAADLMRPGFVAATGYDAAAPLLDEVGKLIGPIAFFENFVTIIILMFAWVVVLLAFFILAIQLFMTIIEFKLTTLAGFILVPFALWNKTSFLAEKVLGNVIAAGIKLMVLAVIVGIGSTLFSTFANSFSGGDITFEQAAATVLGALSIFMLGIFGPGIAAGLVSGAPQLGAGAIVGSAAGLAIGGAAATGAAIGGVRALGSVFAAPPTLQLPLPEERARLSHLGEQLPARKVQPALPQDCLVSPMQVWVRLVRAFAILDQVSGNLLLVVNEAASKQPVEQCPEIQTPLQKHHHQMVHPDGRRNFVANNACAKA